MAWHTNHTDAVGGSGYLVSRLIQTENIATPEARDKLTEALVAAREGLFHFVAGKGVQEADPDGTKTSVTPAWRKTVLHFDTNVQLFDQDPKHWKEVELWAHEKISLLRKVTPNSGAYWNEADKIEPNWEQSFWGMENYKKLKEIKQKYDPTGMFRVWQGIGGTRPETVKDSL